MSGDTRIRVQSTLIPERMPPFRELYTDEALRAVAADMVGHPIHLWCGGFMDPNKPVGLIRRATYHHGLGIVCDVELRGDLLTQWEPPPAPRHTCPKCGLRQWIWMGGDIIPDLEVEGWACLPCKLFCDGTDVNVPPVKAAPLCHRCHSNEDMWKPPEGFEPARPVVQTDGWICWMCGAREGLAHGQETD